MDYGLDLIMNPLKTKKCKYQIPKSDKVSIYDFIYNEISNDGKIGKEYTEENIKKIIHKSIEIYSEYRPNKYVEDRNKIIPKDSEINIKKQLQNVNENNNENNNENEHEPKPKHEKKIITTKKIEIIEKKPKSKS